MTTRPVGSGRPEAPPADQPGAPELAELLLVVAAVAQGAVLAAWLGLFPQLALRAGGFPAAPVFFVRWAGAFHLALALGYALEWLRLRRVTLLLTAKSVTLAFLLITWMLDGLPGLLVVAVSVEGTMALAAALLRGPADRSRRARARLRLVTPAPTQFRPAGQR